MRAEPQAGPPLAPHCPGCPAPKTFPVRKSVSALNREHRGGGGRSVSLFFVSRVLGMGCRPLLGAGVSDRTALSISMHTLPASPLVQTCIVQTADLVHLPYERQRAGDIQDTQVREGVTYSCSREASPLNACLSIAWISFLYR